MDRNTVIGLVLIGGILAAFAIFNQPSDEEIKKAKKEQELAEAKKKEETSKKEDAKKEKKEDAKEDKKEEVKEDTLWLGKNWVAKLDDNGEQLADSTGALFYTDTVAQKDTLVAELPNQKPEEVIGEIVQLQTDKLIIDFDTKGGQIAEVHLKEYETYEEFAKDDGKITPLALFKRGDATQGLSFPMGERQVNTANVLFDVKSKTEDKIVFEWKDGDGSIEYVYQLKDGQYDLDFDINVRGFEGKVLPKNVMFNWDVAFRKTERLFSEQRRVSTICYNYKNEGFSYLSETSTDDEKAEDALEWVCFKQSYFSAFVKPDKPFAKTGSELSITTYEEGEAKDSTHLKDYSSSVNLDLKNVSNASASMNIFFGPNDYSLLTSYDANYDKILNYGWGIFRWINIYAIQPLFKLLASSGMAIGIAILLLTIILKLALMPVQWKMYTSSAKMRILKPEIEAISKKYPNKEDSMKKQMETMTLYRESGASPLAGCVPMLIQMPILLAVFRFFPATFDLRQKSFLWAEDLSSYDSIASLPWEIPFYGDHISLFTLLMAGTTLVYTFINSGNMTAPQQEGMPNMKIIMYIFPIMMIFFFNNYSSGLSYYYFISTLMSILIMIAIKRFFVDEDKLKAKMANRKAAAAPANGKKGKSKFQERLERMQKAQQEQMNKRKK